LVAFCEFGESRQQQGEGAAQGVVFKVAVPEGGEEVGGVCQPGRLEYCIL
jgi:hypothetical protein